MASIVMAGCADVLPAGRHSADRITTRASIVFPIILALPVQWRRVEEEGLAAQVHPPSGGYCLMFMLTPAAPSVNLMPLVVALSVTRTPFWFCMVEMLPPPATAAPAPTAV